ncbi:MAG: chitobiase/beta-hexosaminidase C-terminal domain-containing protein [Alistipes finegoldii]
MTLDGSRSTGTTSPRRTDAGRRAALCAPAAPRLRTRDGRCGRAHSLTRGEVVSIPYTTQNVSLFTEPLAVALATTTSGAEIRYTLDGSEPTETSALYAAPVPVDRSLTLKAKGFKSAPRPVVR